MKRPILIALIGYIIGILWGLYLNLSIALFVVFLSMAYLIAKTVVKEYKQLPKNLKLRRIYRKSKKYLYSKETKKAIIIVLIFASISNFIVTQKNKEYEEIYNNISKGKFIATVVEENKESRYYVQYKIKLKSNTYAILKVKNKTKLELGNKVEFVGELEEPTGQRNYMGFNYKEYLKTKKVYGIITTNSVKVIEKDSVNIIQNFSNKISKHIKTTLRESIKDDNQYNLLLGLLIGADDNLDEDIKNDFKDSSLSHILAVSGMHVSYLILSITILFSKARVSKKISKIITIFILIIFACITGFSASVLRAVIMSCLIIIADLIYKRSDIINNISISLFAILIDNPFCINDLGLILSFAGTIGIVAFQAQILEKFYDKNKELALANKLTILEKLYKKIIEIAVVSISAQICILPIMVYNFNNISLTFLISNILVSFLIGPITILGFVLAIIPIQVISCILSMLLGLLIAISEIVSKLPFSKITVVTPNISTIILYYSTIYIIYTHMWKKKLKLSTIVDNVCTFVNKKRKMLITVLLIMCMLYATYTIIPKGLTIHCIDVGQGDSTLIIANNKKILIDGGGSNNSNFDVGESTLVPYLLDRKIKKLDYIMVSHFDTDHCGGLFAVLETLKVKNIVISKQYKKTQNFTDLIELAKRRNIRIIQVKAGDKLKIDKNTSFKILWPYPQEMIEENAINNNSIVAKLEYKNFSMLFTRRYRRNSRK